MSIGNTQAYLDWAAMQREDDEHEWQEIHYEMTRAEREEYAHWLDTLEFTHEQENDHAY